MENTKKTIPVRLDLETWEELRVKLLREGKSAQEFFYEAAQRFVQDEELEYHTGAKGETVGVIHRPGTGPDGRKLYENDNQD